MDCTFRELGRANGIGLHRCTVCGYQRSSPYESCRLHHPCRGTPAEHARKRAAMLQGELLPSTSHLTAAEYVRLSVRRRWATYPEGEVRPLAEIEGRIAREEAAGSLPTGCPSKLDGYVAALLRPIPTPVARP
ncbi:MAG: hypothetical protein ACLQLG_13590 [Thermoguttaceae bacterium]